MKYPNKIILRKLFYYDNGKLYRKINNRQKTNRKEKYIRIMINKQRYFLHRLIWIFHYGNIEKNMIIDHIDHNTHNNKIENLRKISQKENLLNKSKQKNNTSGYSGIYWNKQKQKWRVRIFKNKKKFHFGYFDNLKEAIEMRKLKLKEFGFHYNHKL